MTTRDLSGAVWRKAIRSGDTGNCVEVATNLSDVVLVRDTKDREGGTLTFTPADWSSFLNGVRAGEFDL